MVCAIRVEGLFGRFDYELTLCEEGITVLTGPNGAGKSTLLSLAAALSEGASDVLLRTPFFSLSVVTDKETVRLQKTERGLGYFRDGREINAEEAARLVGSVRFTSAGSLLSAALSGEAAIAEYGRRLRSMPELIRKEIGINERKLKLFTELLSERVEFKRPTVTKADGLVFYDVGTGERLDFARLSAGEISLVAFYYDVLFALPDGGLLLIDEPEASLHIAWQLTLIDDLYKILALKCGAQAIVSTHSPQVLSRHLELQVDLGEQYEC